MALVVLSNGPADPMFWWLIGAAAIPFVLVGLAILENSIRNRKDR